MTVTYNKIEYNESEIAKLDAQGRHRSEWCYAPYDGRKIPPPKNGANYDQDDDTNPPQ